jgi:hypothetical protein
MPKKGSSKSLVKGRENTLVPWNQNPMTDSTRLSGRTMQSLPMRKSYALDNWLVQSSSAFVSSAYSFALSQITDASSLATVFDQYRVLAVEVVLRPVASDLIAATVLPTGLLYTVIDYDDTSVLTNGTLYTAYDNCIVTDTSRSQRRCFRPRVAAALYGGSTFTSYGNVPAPWIDCTSNTVPHYGIKVGIDQGNSTQLQTYSLTATVEIEFRQVR